MNEVIKSLELLQPTQESIEVTRKGIFSSKADAKDVMEILKTRLRSVHSYSKQLALFYLFNDMIQFAARSKIVSYLEAGATVFLPEVTRYVIRMSDREREPFLRTLQVWIDRRVLSSSYVQRLRSAWEGKLEASSKSSENTEVQRRFLIRDPRLSDCHEIGKRLANQSAVTFQLSSELDQMLNKPSLQGGKAYVDQREGTNMDILKSLLTALCAELNDISALLISAKSNSITSGSSKDS